MANPGHSTNELENAAYRLIEQIKTEPVADHELEKAKNNVEARFYFDQQSNEGLANRIADYESIGAGWEYISTYADRISSVTKEQIMEVTARYFTEKNRTVAVLITETEAGK